MATEKRLTGAEVLAIPMGDKTIGSNLIELLRLLWDQKEAFSGKRPYGDSSWEYDFYQALLVAGAIDGELDAEGFLETCDDVAGDALIRSALETLAAHPPKAVSSAPQGCDIEIVERVSPDQLGKGDGVVIPSEIRINGTPVLASADDPLIVHEMNLCDRDCVKVTLTLFARRVHIGEEAKQ